MATDRDLAISSPCRTTARLLAGMLVSGKYARKAAYRAQSLKLKNLNACYIACFLQLRFQADDPYANHSIHFLYLGCVPNLVKLLITVLSVMMRVDPSPRNVHGMWLLWVQVANLPVHRPAVLVQKLLACMFQVEVRSKIRDLQRFPGEGVRWMSPEMLHDRGPLIRLPSLRLFAVSCPWLRRQR